MRKMFLVSSILAIVSMDAQAAQDCTLQYLGRNASQSLPGEAGVVVPEQFLDPPTSELMSEPFYLRLTYGHRISGDAYQSTNIWRMYLATPLDPSSTVTERQPALDVFQITCSD
jgi:hypothetical protein